MPFGLLSPPPNNIHKPLPRWHAHHSGSTDFLDSSFEQWAQLNCNTWGHVSDEIIQQWWDFLISLKKPHVEMSNSPSQAWNLWRNVCVLEFSASTFEVLSFWMHMSSFQSILFLHPGGDNLWKIQYKESLIADISDFRPCLTNLTTPFVVDYLQIQVWSLDKVPRLYP